MSRRGGSKKTASKKRPRGERIHKVLAQAGVASRRRVEEMISEGRITVDGRVAVLGQRIDLATDAVKVDGKRVFSGSGERRYILLNKPAGHVSTRDDPEGRATVLDLLPPRLQKGLVPVGRLDYESEGLMILTNDGDLAQHVAHPRYGCQKTYEAKVKGRPEVSAIRRLRDGIVLDGKRTAPAFVASRSPPSGPRESVSNSWWTVKLGEGRTRQIREMFFRIGHPVSRLRRVAIGSIADPHLLRGSWRELTEREVDQLRQQTARPVAKPSRPPARRRPVGGKPSADKAASGKPASGKPASGKPAVGKRAASKSPSGKPPSGKRPAGKAAARPVRGKSSKPPSGRRTTGRPAGGRGKRGRSRD